MTTQSVVAREIDQRIQSIQWDTQSPLSMSVETRQGMIHTKHGRFIGGAADQVEVIEVDSGAVRVMILPTRGMSIWQMEANGIRFGWNSPVNGPVHPSQVPVFDPNGIGWLEGFDELVVRCGLRSNGAPEHDEQGRLVYPLHGRIGNLAADSLSIEYDEASGRLEVIGEILESRLFINRLRLRSRIRFQAGSASVDLLDDVTNELSQPTTMQLLYHINVGAPILGEGASLEFPVDTLAPKDTLSADEIDSWNEFLGPQEEYPERVYFATPCSDDQHQTAALLRSRCGTHGMGVTFHTAGLPRFILWKNTASQSDGYVIGMEPATNYPNQRSFEEKHGRVVSLDGGDTASFRVSLHALTEQSSVTQMSDRIRVLQEEATPNIENRPKPGWSPGA